MTKFFQPYLYGLIKEEIKRVEEAYIAPAVVSKRATMSIVQKDIDEAIEALATDGLITQSENVNRIPLYKLTNCK